ncbi:hypothetical protein DRQ25_04765 [Candidatus Fermentibacteria bacterium]|nr:MAG: hypothetical protein DRQ25_04765 [Candidatus Fermentibacteria bacterium]
MDITSYCKRNKGVIVGNACIVGERQRDSPFAGTPKELANEINSFFHRKLMNDPILSVGLAGFGLDLDATERFQVARNPVYGMRSIGIVTYTGEQPIPKLKPRAKLVKGDEDFTEEEIARFQKHIGGYIS